MAPPYLDTPYLDTSADQLSFSLDDPAQPALAIALVELDGVGVELRLLGASHQVFAGPVRETLACLPGRPGGGPPPSVNRRLDGWSYRFTSRVEHCAPAELSRRVATLRARLADRDGALCGVFPGSPDAVTALWARGPAAGGVEWRTWHAYPQTDQLVITRTRLERP
ncbi:DUF2617 family protein [Streptomyces hainanensis]|uniref:DUF2617 family protein n=1 Tax=Streptomyces hainanensis TaxID=402648 RepID=A0A4R4TAA4_9ACTN|nr:DUF2617 family protein [Streptomyces hainanensis]